MAKSHAQFPGIEGGGGSRVDRETSYGLSWSNTKWNPQMINAGNVLEYFSDRTNPFYDRECNNELIRMQRLSLDQLVNMHGIEYNLHNAQEPILYIICKQQRHNPTSVTPLAMYYIINGVVHQSPDISAVINSRLLTSLYYMNTAFQEMMSYTNYQPTTGTYSWNFDETSAKLRTRDDHDSEGTAFQRQRVDFLLADWESRFPAPELPLPPGPMGDPPGGLHAASPPPSSSGTGQGRDHVGEGNESVNGGQPPDKKVKYESGQIGS